MSERLRAIDRQTRETHYIGQGEYEDYEIAFGKAVEKREEIEKIIDLTLEYYEQEAVLAYRVADEVILKNKGDKHLKYFAIYSTLIEDVTGTVTCAANTPDPLVERGERLISITEEEYNGVSFDYPSGFAPEVLKKILKRGKI